VGTFNSTAPTAFLLQFFSSSATDPSGNGEGQTLIGAQNVVTDASGKAAFTAVLPAVQAGQFITATATLQTAPLIGVVAAGSFTPATATLRGDTSEFSNALQVAGAPPPLPTLSISDVTHAEGNSGTTPFIFTVTRTGDTTGSVSVQFATADGAGPHAAILADSDYQSATGTLTFGAGVTSQQITVLVNGDTTVEPDETFAVNLSGVVGATLARGQAVGTILNDDSITQPPTAGSISGVVFDDKNRNTLRDGNERLLKGFTVYLDSNDNGHLDTGEPRQTVGADGAYKFGQLPAGSYFVRLKSRAGFHQTKPPGAGPHAVVLADGQMQADEDFGVTRIASLPGKVTGVVFHDSNKNKTQDKGESGLAGRVVFIDSNNNGNLDAGETRAMTNQIGRYSFSNVAPGTVRIRLLGGDDHTTVPPDAFFVFQIASGQMINRNFGLK
jgi:hypothetical protein